MCAFRYRRPLEPGLKIAITLRFLATGDSFQSMEFNWRAEHNTIGMFVPEVCDAIVEEYAQEVFCTPTTTDGWLEIAQGFQDKWNFPHVCGAIDGKHVAIRKPKHSGSIYYKYKGFFSTVILVLCDANYKSIWAYGGSPGSQSEGGIYNDSPMFQGIQDENHKAPSTSTTAKWHWGYSVLLHRGWRIPPTSAHAKAVLCEIPWGWAARLQLPAVTCQTGCRKPI